MIPLLLGRKISSYNPLFVHLLNPNMDYFALHDAAGYGDLKTVRRLIEEGVSVDSREPLRRTALHVAAYMGQYNVVQLLICSKCDINALDHYGTTPVMSAAELLKKDVVDLLLRHGAQVNHADRTGFSLLHMASYNGWADTVQHILNVEDEVDVDATIRGGDTPLMMAADTGAEDCVKILLRAGADPNRREEINSTALHFAVNHGQTGVVRVLLGEERLDLNPQNVFGRTPLHSACNKEGCTEILKEMLEAGADYTIRDNDGETALSEGIKLMKLTLEDIRLFVQQGLFLQEKEYMRIFQNSALKESVLKDASLCTQSIVNKFHRQSLPALKSIRYFAEQLPNIDNFQLSAREIDEVEELVKCEIGRSNFCNVLKIHPMSLKALCILTLITY